MNEDNKEMTERERFAKSLAKQVKPITLAQMKHLAELEKIEKNEEANRITENPDDYSLVDLYNLCLLNKTEDDSEKEEL